MKLIVLSTIALLSLATIGQAQEKSAHTNYVLRCAGCHGMSGSGAPAAGIFDFNGMVGAFAGIDEGRTYLMHVPGVAGSGLSDSEIAAVMNYVMETWAGDSLPEPYEPFTAAEVTERRAIAIPDIVENRRQVAALLQTMGIETADYPWP
ncbi:cytochrome c [Pelagibacterium flavum]|uniref:Cytochrome c n=1 Tax=Pelagibacterium flavum TaxID=2984530 RepID=A0ABY6IQA7_9HYPH|nr:cytochrome c [Pelagibacterium sp. YIM 151497]UYQ72786.1 cytochrome c [Pelagibacterium sp. YIM 151497]